MFPASASGLPGDAPVQAGGPAVHETDAPAFNQPVGNRYIRCSPVIDQSFQQTDRLLRQRLEIL